MTKRIISMVLAILLILPCIGSIGLAAEIGAADCIYYDDFENFDASAYTNVTDGKYSIGTDNTKYLSVKQAMAWQKVFQPNLCLLLAV